MFRDLAVALSEGQTEAGVAPTGPMFLELPDDTVSAASSEWLAKVVGIATDNGLTTSEAQRDALRTLIVASTAGERGPGSSGRVLYVLDSSLRSIVYDLFFWSLGEEDGAAALDDGLLQLIGSEPDPELGAASEWIENDRATIRERFHVYEVDVPDSESDERPLIWVGGFATALTLAGSRAVGVAAFAATPDVGAVIASLNSITEYISGSEDAPPLALGPRSVT